MEDAIIVYSVFARLLAVASAVLGFIAETKKLTPDDIYYSEGMCVYPASPAFTLGICAASLLVVAQIIVNLVGRFSGNGGASGSKRIRGNVCYVLSWVATVLAVGWYAQGVVWNAATTRDPESRSLSLVRCTYLKGDAFVKAALLSLAATVLGISSVVMLRGQQQAPAVAAASPTAPAAAAPPPPSGPKPDAPPAGEAVALPVERYAQTWNPQSSHPPQRQAQPAYEVMMA